MKFEDALIQMRQGSKITHPFLEEDVYFQACRVGIIFDDRPQDSWPISIVKMKGDRQHPDMWQQNIENSCKDAFGPQLNLFLVMSDEWEIINE